MKPSLVCLLAVFMLCGCAWGKAVVLEKVRDLQLLQTETMNRVDEVRETVENGPCVYKGNIFTADVTKIADRFNGQNITDSDVGKYVYFLSPCSPIACSFAGADSEENETAAGCQYIASQDHFVTLGSSSSYKWTLVNTTYFYITFSDGDPAADVQRGRRLRINFKVGDTCSRRPTIEHDGDINSEDSKFIDYTFTINIKADEALTLNDDVEM